MVFGNGVKNIQAAAYNGARTVGKEGRLQHHRQCSKDNFEEDQTTTTTTH